MCSTKKCLNVLKIGYLIEFQVPMIWPFLDDVCGSILNEYTFVKIEG